MCVHTHTHNKYVGKIERIECVADVDTGLSLIASLALLAHRLFDIKDNLLAFRFYIRFSNNVFYQKFNNIYL